MQQHMRPMRQNLLNSQQLKLLRRLNSQQQNWPRRQNLLKSQQLKPLLGRLHS